MGGALVLLAAPVVQAGRDYSSLPHGMNDKISSIQVLGDAEVTVFQDARDKHR
jgi:hypothetical protein